MVHIFHTKAHHYMGLYIADMCSGPNQRMWCRFGVPSECVLLVFRFSVNLEDAVLALHGIYAPKPSNLLCFSFLLCRRC